MCSLRIGSDFISRQFVDPFRFCHQLDLHFRNLDAYFNQLENHMEEVFACPFFQNGPIDVLFNDHVSRVAAVYGLDGVSNRRRPRITIRARNRSRRSDHHRQNNNNVQRSSVNIVLQPPSHDKTKSKSSNSNSNIEYTVPCSDDEICAICREKFKDTDDIRQLPCEHLFHPNCLYPWLRRRNTCPTCRRHL